MSNKEIKTIPAEYAGILDAVKLNDTIAQLDSATSEILAAGQANEAVYGDKAELAKQARDLTTEIQLAESEALMQIQGEGKEAYAIVGNLKVALTNDKARDAYRVTASKTHREELAKVESQIAKIDVEIAKTKETYYAKQEASQNIRAKANLQAALLNFLR